MKLDEAILPALPLPPSCPNCGHSVDVASCGDVEHVSQREAWEIADRLACAKAGALAALDEALHVAAGCASGPSTIKGIRRLRDTIMEGKLSRNLFRRVIYWLRGYSMTIGTSNTPLSAEITIYMHNTIAKGESE